MEPDVELVFYDQFEFVKSFCYLGERLNASGGNKAVVTARAIIRWLKLRNVGSCFI